RSFYSLFGTHSSSNSRMSLSHLARALQRPNCLLTGHRRKIGQELAERVAGFKVVVEILDWHTRADEHRSATQNHRIAVNHRGLDGHVGFLLRFKYKPLGPRGLCGAGVGPRAPIVQSRTAIASTSI